MLLTPSWKPLPKRGRLEIFFGRFCSFGFFPALLPFAIWCRCDATAANAIWWRNTFAAAGVCLSTFFHGLVHRNTTSLKSILLGHALVVYTVDHPFSWLTYVTHILEAIFQVDRTQNRLTAGQLKGPRICIVGNGPSALEGEPLGDVIDQFDEVARFNNFQTKRANMEKWLGSKTTVHFSDGCLYPTFTEYHVPGATVVLTLFIDRLMVAGTYFIQRGGIDLRPVLAKTFLNDFTTTWLDKEQIERMKDRLGLVSPKHPTSGMLAIDYFVNKAGVELPVYIHGFDFFQGPKVHYFDEHEPLWERINDRLGLNQHSPLKEKEYVAKLVAEGKVRFLQDRPPTRG